MKKSPVIAIFDIGKTNKKLFLFDEHYQIVCEKSEQFVEIHDEDGDLCEDLNRLTNWITSSLTEVLALPDFSVQAVNFSTYGASLVLVDKAGKPLCPLYNYLKAYPPALLQQFFSTYGPESKITRQTASPSLSSLNSGLQLYRFKYEQPDLFKRLATRCTCAVCQLFDQPMAGFGSDQHRVSYDALGFRPTGVSYLGWSGEARCVSGSGCSV